MFVIFTTIKIAAFLAYIALAFLTLRSKAERVVRTLFTVYIFGMALGQFSSVMANFSREASAALFWYNLLMAGSGTYSILSSRSPAPC